VHLTDIYRVLHPAIYTFSAAHGTFSNIDHILHHKVSLNKHKNVEINHCMLSDHNRITLELNNRRNSRTYSYTWR
jgi:endonuclease/exonuclease/phosphatase family metal-dependent hydrolase